MSHGTKKLGMRWVGTPFAEGDTVLAGSLLRSEQREEGR
jgi:hypothetical protein